MKVQLQRRWPGFKSKVSVLPQALPGYLRIANGEIAAGKDEVTLTVNVQPGTPPGEYTLTVLGQAQCRIARMRRRHRSPTSSCRCRPGR